MKGGRRSGLCGRSVSSSLRLLLFSTEKKKKCQLESMSPIKLLLSWCILRTAESVNTFTSHYNCFCMCCVFLVVCLCLTLEHSLKMCLLLVVCILFFSLFKSSFEVLYS